MRKFEKYFKLPFRSDRFGDYVFDSNGNMVLQFENANQITGFLITEYLNSKTNIATEEAFAYLSYNNVEGIIEKGNLDPFIVIRGFGYLTGNLKLTDLEASDVQDDLAMWILEKLTPVKHEN